MKTKLVTLICILFLSFGYSQTKVGTMDSELVVGLMPETKRVLTLLSNYSKRLDSSYQVKVKEYQDRVAAFQKLKGVSDNYKKIKVEEIQELERGLKQSQTNGNQLIQLKRNELMRPLYKKVRTVVAEIAKANGYTQILTTSGNEFAYIDENHDLTKKVLKKMGIEIPKNPEKK